LVFCILQRWQIHHQVQHQQSSTLPNNQQTNRAVDDITPQSPAASQEEAARASLQLAFQTLSGQRSAASAAALAAASAAASAESSRMLMPKEHDEASIAAGPAAAATTIDDSSMQPPDVCLLNLAGRNDTGMNLSSVLEEAKTQCDGGDSNVEGNDAQDHDGAMNDCLVLFWTRMQIVQLKRMMQPVEEADENCAILTRGVALSAAPAPEAVIHVPDALTGWMPPVLGQRKANLPLLKLTTQGVAPKQECNQHGLPAVAQPAVPANPKGQRIADDREFHCKG
jgi:hypothetical protein